MKPALLALEDGTIFPGLAFGAPRAAGGEVIFNTSMCGYQEILTDPSYHGQIVVFTAPHVGNYGVHRGEEESARLQAAGVVTREVCSRPVHPHFSSSLPRMLEDEGIPGITEVDTRALTLHLRSRGTLRGWLSLDPQRPDEAVRRAREVPPMDQIPAVEQVMTGASYRFGDPTGTDVSAETHEDGARVVVLDCGVKRSILRQLRKRGCQVLVLPGDSPPEAIERLSPDGLVLSNGPGDPAALISWAPRIERLLRRTPTLAVCLGHQLVSLALGCRTVKLPFGHHGGNHPVMELAGRRVFITAQNHNYAVDPTSLCPELAVTHLNLNDGTVEGLRHATLPLWSLQYHPEAGPGPHEAASVFDEFVGALPKGRR